ncbi:SDR family NAD(P)-dependent oxidoreductase [Bauldia litoralis]|uniref:SDR family NAD(P)-dependent oxidoreductase n=1 Tax=Bauldia litoralis TaxID=665467 RepID=UPI003267343D
MSDKPLSGRVAVVTGASRGVGYAAARAMAAAGAHIIAVARTVGGLEELDDEIRAMGGEATLVPFDLKDFAAIDRLGGAIYERWGKLDILLGNAGMLGVITPMGHLEPKVFDDVMAVNVTANWRLIRSLDPLLRQSDAGRALFVTSGAAHRCRPYWGVYSASKAALEALVLTYARELRQTAVTANLLDPGPLRTHMRAQGRPGEDPETLEHPRAVTPDIVRMVSPDHAPNGVLFSFPDNQTRDLMTPL